MGVSVGVIYNKSNHLFISIFLIFTGLPVDLIYLIFLGLPTDLVGPPRITGALPACNSCHSCEHIFCAWSNRADEWTYICRCSLHSEQYCKCTFSAFECLNEKKKMSRAAPQITEKGDLLAFPSSHPSLQTKFAQIGK